MKLTAFQQSVLYEAEEAAEGSDGFVAVLAKGRRSKELQDLAEAGFIHLRGEVPKYTVTIQPSGRDRIQTVETGSGRLSGFLGNKAGSIRKVVIAVVGIAFAIVVAIAFGRSQ